MNVVAALMFAVVACLAQSVALPSPALACSCVQPPPLAEIAATEDVAVVAGTLGPAQRDRTPIGIETWFHGGNPTDVVWLSTGTEMATSCDIFFSAGERWLLVLYPAERGLYSAISCSPNGRLGTPEGDALLQEAVSTFGGGQAPPTPEPEAAATPEPSPWLGAGLVWVAGAVGAAGVLFGAIFVLAGRKRTG